MKLMSHTAQVGLNLNLDRPRTCGKPNTTILENECTNKFTPNSKFSIVIDQCLAQPSLENLLLAVGGKNYQGPQMDNIQRVSPEWDVSIKFISLGFRDLYRRSSRNTVRVSGDGRHQEAKLSRRNRTDAHMNSQRLRSMHRACTGLNQMAYRTRRVDTITHS